MIKKICLMLLATAAISHATFAQGSKDQRTLTTRIADLLAQLPGRNAEQLKTSMLEVTDMGEDGYVTLISGLTAPVKGNIALLEYAIGGYSAYVRDKANEADRMMSVNAYCKALTTATDKQNKEFLISQLELVGKDDAVH
jgi:hypothetical protein